MLDENVDTRIASFLKKKGFSVSISPKGIKDCTITTLAQKQRRILLTNDTDFADTLTFQPKKYYGIVIFRIHPPTFPKLSVSLEKLLNQLTPSKSAGKTFLLYEDGFTVVE